ncbi:hypothetical protein CALVIDRAFT_540716 [Calocera viscosa TUFC12733]|uniref:Uncharacterized protein n=1 Tax=Calocera viscosa (strain TUFC12733) TaxID=1330018 RepID=A0A167IGX5_CALVF|nr:hypothetical protein CALVIDRAFT_540716 [Calocera viscosa TUFC12733]
MTPPVVLVVFGSLPRPAPPSFYTPFLHPGPRPTRNDRPRPVALSSSVTQPPYPTPHAHDSTQTEHRRGRRQKQQLDPAAGPSCVSARACNGAPRSLSPVDWDLPPGVQPVGCIRLCWRVCEEARVGLARLE